MRFTRMSGIVLLACSTAAAAEGNGRLSRDLEDLARSGRGSDAVDIIIQADPASLDRLTGEVWRHGGSTRRRLARGMAATVSLSSLEELSAAEGIRHISPDREVVSTLEAEASGDAISWPRWSSPLTGEDGTGVGVAVIDSGVADHEDLPAGAVRARLDFVSPRSGAAEENSGLQDAYGHGTHVAGIIAGRPSGPFGGVAPGAHLVSLRVLDARGRGLTSDVIAALDWCIENAPHHGLRVINLSLGQPAAEPPALDPLAQAVERAWHAGLVVVASAGNAGGLGSGYGTISSPGHDPLVITVGALADQATPARPDDAVAPFSSRGPTRFAAMLKPDLVAAGVRVASLRVPHSTLDRTMPEARVPETMTARHFQMSGSSMAAGVVSGAAALMLQSDPGLTPDDVKARLMRGADHQLAGGVLERGAGALDVTTALGDQARADGSPSPMLRLEEDDVAIVHDAQAWGDPAAWSLEQIYGDPALWMEEAALTQGFFDDPCLTGDGIIWQTMSGTGIVWQTMTAEGVIWQTLTADGVIWQTVRGKGVIWQNTTCPF